MLPERRRRSLSPRDRVVSHDQHRTRSPPRSRQALPFGRRQLDKYDLKEFRPLFADYLHVQKKLDLDSLPETELRGRWKSFTGKWNRGELAEGWYDPSVLQRAIERVAQGTAEVRPLHKPAKRPSTPQDDDDDGELGPALPPGHNAGPAMPSLQDLQYRREQQMEDRQDSRSQHQYERRVERKAHKERLDELVPRADPGSRERQLEKKREVAATKKAFANAKESGDAEIAESDLMGEDGIDAYKARLKSQERIKNEREIRREEVLRARAAEREERLAEHRRKEDKTMAVLKALAAQRYGTGNAT